MESTQQELNRFTPYKGVSIPDCLELFKKIGFHFGGAEDIDFLVGVKAVKVAATRYDQAEAICQINEIRDGAHSFVIRVMAFEAQKPHLFQLFQQNRDIFG